MNPNQLINMVTRMFLNKGINQGINHIARGGKRPEDMSREEREAAKRNRGNANNARRGLNILRRLGRF